MSDEFERFLENQDEAVSLAFVQNKGDELTDILVAALEEALGVLRGQDPSSTVH